MSVVVFDVSDRSYLEYYSFCSYKNYISIISKYFLEIRNTKKIYNILYKYFKLPSYKIHKIC